MNALHVRLVHQFAPSAPPPRHGDGITDVISYISQLNLEDIENIQSRVQDKQEEYVLSDEELALALFAEEAEGLLNIARERRNGDHTASRSILEELEEMEEAARYDRLVALAISQGNPIPPRPQRTVVHRSVTPELPVQELDESSDESDEDLALEEQVLLTRAVMNSIITQGEASTSSSSSSSSLVGEPAATAVTDLFPDLPIDYCTICGDAVEQSYTAPCGHAFDLQCLEAMFRRATYDESLYPPRCCQQPIPVMEARPFLDSKLVATFAKKTIEFETLDRVYCHKPKCSAFIGPATEEKQTLQCPDCSAATCGSCKAGAHPGLHCSDREDLNDMAKRMHETEGWQRCPSCHHLVEKSEGCYHITCICKAQFCYLCATPWKGCSCPQFEVPPET